MYAYSLSFFFWRAATWTSDGSSLAKIPARSVGLMAAGYAAPQGETWGKQQGDELEAGLVRLGKQIFFGEMF